MIQVLPSNTLYLAIDPSFKGFGVAASYGGHDRTFELSVEGSVKDSALLAGHVFELMGKLWKEYLSLLPGNLRVVAIIEMPPPRSLFSSGLFFLVGGLIMYLKKTYSDIEIYGTSSMTIKSIHGSRKASKVDSVALAQRWAREQGCSEVFPGLSHNRADAFILLVFLFQTVLGIEVIKDDDYSKRLNKPRFSKLI